MAAGDIGHLGAWPKRFFDDPRLLVLAPPTPPLRPDQDLAPHPSPVLKDVLYRPGTSSGRLHDGHALGIYEGVGTSLTTDLFVAHGPPEHIRSDQGSEFIANVVKDWLGRIGVRTLYIEKASPWENGYNESFNGKLRDELLNCEIFYTLAEGEF